MSWVRRNLRFLRDLPSLYQGYVRGVPSSYTRLGACIAGMMDFTTWRAIDYGIDRASRGEADAALQWARLKLRNDGLLDPDAWELQFLYELRRGMDLGRLPRLRELDMAFAQHTLVLTGSVQRLSNALPDPAPGGKSDIPARMISFQPDGGNKAAIYVGDANVSASFYAFRLEPGTADVPPPPEKLGNFDAGPIKLSDYYVLGRAGDDLHVGVIPY